MFGKISLLLIFCLLLTFTITFAAENTAGTIFSVVNNVQIMRQNSGTWEQAYNWTTFNYGDQIRALENSKAMVVFNDKTQLKIDERTTIYVKSGDEKKPGLIELFAGAIWAKIKPSDEGNKLQIQSPSSTCSIRGTELALKVDGDNKQNLTTTLTVLQGEVEMGNSQGKSLIPASCQSSAYSGKAPTSPVKLTKEQIDREISWIDFGNPRVMVLIKEVNLGKENTVPEVESEINNRLTDAHYHIIDPTQVDTIRQTDEAKKTILGDPQAAATLGKRFGCDVTVTGTVETIFLSEEKTGGNTLIKCEARCDIKIIVTDTAQLLFSKKIKSEGTSLSKEAAGIRALEKISSSIAEDLVWEIPMGYITNYKGHRTMQVVAENCSFTERDKLMEFLKSIPGLDGKVYPRTFENSIAVIDVEYKGTSEELARKLLEIQTIKIDITGITMNRIQIKVIK